EIRAITLRTAKGGHRLRSSAKDVQTPRLSRGDKGQLHYEGFTADDFTQALGRDFRRPVENLTALEGRWSFSLSKAAIRLPEKDETVRLDDLGLELRWETVKARVTVVKDKPKE